MNKITLNFETCSPEPSGGYSVYWRVAGSGDPYTNAGNFFVTPAVFYDNANPEGTCYEGYILTNCGNGIYGSPVNWQACESGSGGLVDVTLTFTVIGGGAGANIKAEFSDPIDVALSIDEIFVDGYTAASCVGPVDSHMHSTNETISAGNTAYIGADVKTGAWIGIASYTFFGIVLTWPGNSSVLANDGDIVIMGSYSVTIIIDGC